MIRDPFDGLFDLPSPMTVDATAREDRVFDAAFAVGAARAVQLAQENGLALSDRTEKGRPAPWLVEHALEMGAEAGVVALLAHRIFMEDLREHRAKQQAGGET